MFKNLKLLWVLAVVVLAACTKEKSVEKEDAVIENPDVWSFTESSQQYSGLIDTAFIQDVGGVQVLTIQGGSADQKYQLVLLIGAIELKAGDYISPTGSMFFLENASLKFQSDETKPDFKITLTQIDATTVSGTFSGMVADANGNITEVSSGSFAANLQ